MMPIRRTSPIICAALAFLALAQPSASAFEHPLHIWGPNKLERVNAAIGGRVCDYTNNHGVDRRICSKALDENRDLYVYVPPGYDGKTQFPFMLWLHGFGHDEKHFLAFVPHLDEGIRTGALPPMVIVAPDGSFKARPALFNTGSFYLNTKAGRFEDYIAEDVVGFALKTFAIRPEREAHVIAGASMGGYGAYSFGFKHKELFGNIAGIMPALSMRYVDCNGKYDTDYDPNCVTLRSEFARNEVVGRFYGVILIRQRRMLDPLFGRHSKDDALATLSANNPIELLESRDVRPEDYKLFLGYAGKDEFNLDAQAEHFLDVAGKRGIRPTVLKLDDGHHNVKTGLRMFPEMARWLKPLIAPYAPANYSGTAGVSSAVLHAPQMGTFGRPLYLAPMPAGPTMYRR